MRYPTLVTCLISLLVVGCNRTTAQQKAAQDARDVAWVEAAQKVHPPVQPLELGKVDPAVRRVVHLTNTGCAFFSDPDPGAFPLLVAGRDKAVLLINGEPAIFAADSGSPELAAGVRTKFAGRSLSAALTREPASLTLRDRWERIVFMSRGRFSCQAEG